MSGREFKGMARSIDVARHAGVSRASVSRAFTEGAVIAEDTRRKVMESARALGYSPNALARSLITRRSNIIGVVIADLDNPFYATVLDEVCQNLQTRGLGTLLMSCRDARQIDELVPRLLSYQVDGIMIAAATLSSTMAQQCVAAGRSVVLINRYLDHEDVSAVVCDNRKGGRLVAQHLVATGHRRIAFMAGLENTSSSRDRELGFVDELSRHGAKLFARDVGNYVYGDAQAAARRLLSRKTRPDAIFCANDSMALALADVARQEFNLSIPRQLSIVGFDNTAPASSTSYDLTSVDQNVPRMVGRAVDVLLKQGARKRTRSGREMVSCNLVVRGSTRASAT